MSITDTWGRTITPTPNADGRQIDYHVVGSGQDFVQSFPATTPQYVAIACIEASSMPSAQATAPVVVVPQTVSRYQAMAIMSVTPSKIGSGMLLADVTAAVNAAGGMALLAWENVSSFDRNGLFVTQLSASLNLSDADLDALFIAASQITA